MGYAGKIEIEEQNHLIGSALYGISSTAGATAEKIVTLPDFDTLVEGITIKVKFLYSNTAADPTLNVNGTGALPIYRHGVTAPGTSSYDTWAANAVLSFTYDGTAWRMEEPFDLTQIRQTMLNAVYPVGSIYMSVNSTSPSSLFGGTWVQLKDRFLLGAGDTYSAGATGGAATHTLTAAEMPGHTHTVGAHSHGLNSHTHTMAHTHGLNSHTHTMAHSHGLNNHTHSIPALSGSVSSNGGYSHTESPWVVGVTSQYSWHQAQGYIGIGAEFNHSSPYYTINDMNTQGWGTTGGYNTSVAGNHTHTVSTNASTTGGNTGSTANRAREKTFIARLFTGPTKTCTYGAAPPNARRTIGGITGRPTDGDATEDIITESTMRMFYLRC